MKLLKILLLFALLMPIAYSIKAQDEEIDTLQFEPRTTMKQKKAYFAIGAGYIGTLLFNNFNDLNIKAKKLSLDDLKAPVYLSGMHVIAALPLLPNTRVGFFSMSGSKLSQKNFNNSTGNLEYNVQMSGFDFDYNIGILSNFLIIPGISLGWGNTKIEYSKAQNQFDWNNNILDSNNYINRAEASFTFIQPNLYFEYAVLPFLMLRANVGYNYSFALSGGWKWTFDRTSTLLNPPSINATGLTAQFGIFLGLFNYFSSGQ